MTWLEVRVETDGEAAEAIAEVFNRLGEGGAVVETLISFDGAASDGAPSGSAPHSVPPAVRVKTYLPGNGTGRRRQIEEALWHLAQLYPIPEPEFLELAEQDWAEAWKSGYHVQHIGQRTVVAPSWEPYTPASDEVVLLLDPGLAFGTGLHPSTRLCLQILEDCVRVGDRILDVGTGSGILGIAAAKLGAADVLGIDVDPVAVRVARDNAALNGVTAFLRIEEGTLESVSPVAAGWDRVVVNILAGVIIDLAPRLARCLAPGGVLVASGIIDDSAPTVATALTAAGLDVIERRVEQDWVALMAIRKTQPSGSANHADDHPQT